MVGPAQAPPIPSVSDLGSLPQPVALALLIVVGVGLLGWYLSPLIKRWSQGPETPPPSPEAPPAPTRAARSSTDPDRFIDHLLAQIDEQSDRIDDLDRQLRAQAREMERRLAAKGRQVESLQDQLRRMETLLWQQEQRGGLG